LILLSWNCLVLSRLQAAAGTVAVLMICRDKHKHSKPAQEQARHEMSSGCNSDAHANCTDQADVMLTATASVTSAHKALAAAAVMEGAPPITPPHESNSALL
jgi:hypothetical protein